MTWFDLLSNTGHSREAGNPDLMTHTSVVTGGATASYRSHAVTLGAFLAVGSIFHDAALPSLPFLTVAKAMFAASVPLLLARSVLTSVVRLELAVIAFCLGLILLQAIARVFGSGISDRTVSLSMSLFMGAISYLILVHSNLHWRQVVEPFGAWVAASVLLGTYQAFTGTGYIDQRVFQSILIEGTWRASGFTNDPNYFSLLCLIGLSLAFALGGLSRWLLVLVAIIGVILSGSRAGIITCGVVLIIAAIGGYFSRKRMLMLVASGLLILTALVGLRDLLPAEIAEIFNWRSYIPTNTDAPSIYYRMTTIMAALQAFTDNPVMGSGLGNFLYHPDNIHNQVSHNTVIEIAAETGLVGLYLFLVLLWQAFRSVAEISDRKLQLALSLTLAAFLLMSMTLVTHYSRIFFVTLAILTITARTFSVQRPSPRTAKRVGRLDS
jgi:O-antigen ligase